MAAIADPWSRRRSGVGLVGRVDRRRRRRGCAAAATTTSTTWSRPACDDPLTQRFLPLLPMPVHPCDDAELVDPRRVARRRSSAGGGLTRSPTRPPTGCSAASGSTSTCRTGPGRDRLLGGAVGARPRRGHRRRPGADRPRLRHRLRPAGAAHPLENTASQRVALAAGFRREGVRRGALPNRDGGRHDLLACARLADDPPGPDAAAAARPAGRRADRRRGDAAPARARTTRTSTPSCTACRTSSRRACRRWHRAAREVAAALRLRGRALAGRRPGRPGHRGRRDRHARRRDRAVLPGAADRAGDDRLQHAAGRGAGAATPPGRPGCVARGRSPRPASPG